MTDPILEHTSLAFQAGQHAQVRHFYAALIGLPEQESADGRTLRFRAGGLCIDLVPALPRRSPADVPQLTLQVENLCGLRARLLDAGVELAESHSLPGHLHFCVRDPAGNALVLREPMEALNGQGGAA